MNKKRIAIILELKNRELPYFVLLKEMLEKQGHTVKLISFRSACSVQLLLFNPQIVVVNGLRSYESYLKQMYIPKRLYGTVVVCLYSEQIVYSKTDSIAETYNNPKILKAVDYHVTWGETFAKALEKIGVPKEKIWVLGSLQNDLKYYLSKTESDLKKQYAAKYGLESSKKWSIIADNVLPSMQNANYIENRKWMDSLIVKVANDNPDVEFILRLHPESARQEMSAVRKNMGSYKNIHVINEGHIYIWSLLCHNMIIAFSTSSITALINKKNVFSLKLPNAIVDNEIYEKYYWNRDVMTVYENVEECAHDIASDFNGEYQAPQDIQAKCDKYIEGFYYKIDGLIFSRYIYLLGNLANLSVKTEKEPMLECIKYLLCDLKGWVGEKLLKKQTVNNVVLQADYNAVHETYIPKDPISQLMVIKKEYNYIEVSDCDETRG